ncbi:D-glycerate dehydrogenase [Patescibacteria group bacterium]|nr:D-glycerate dehydrogenase [Patescibacteria group bacterium]
MKVVITQKIPGPAEEMLKKAGHDVVVGTDFSGADAILSLLTDKVDGAMMDAAGKQLKIVANYAVGFDNIDLEAAKARHVYVTNTPGGFTEAVAEHTFALILAVARRIVDADRFVRDCQYKCWQPELFIGEQLYGKSIGVVGMGRIGSYVAKIAHYGFSMQVLYHSHKPDMQTEAEMGAVFCDSLDELLKTAVVVTLHVPLTAETKHLISKPQLSAMKKTAIIINTARGAVIDEAALITALSEKWIAGAGLDVFEEEANIDLTSSEKMVNQKLFGLPNVVLTPHIGSATAEARAEMSRLAAQNIIAALSGEPPPNLAK